MYSAGFDASWEVDIFGGTRRQVEAAQDLLEAEEDARRDTLITLLAEVAQNYVVLRGSQDRLDITQRNIASQGETVELQGMLLKAGLTSDLSVAQAEAQLRSTSSQLPALEIPIRQSIHRLSVLLGKEPAALEDELQKSAAVPRGPAVVPAGLPSDLLRRRPDIRRAERQLAATTANIGVAMSDFFPKFQLTGAMGMRSTRYGNLFQEGSRFWAWGPGITWNVLDWYAILANIEIQDSRQEQALVSYRSAVLQALEDVENALVAYDREQARYELIQKSVEANKRALDLAQQLNTAGLVDFMNVLNAQRAVFLAEDALSQSSQAVSGDLIALYKALGGGWEEIEDVGERESASNQPAVADVSVGTQPGM